jgi:hypothetical protein
MRTALAATLLAVSTLSQLPLPAARAARGDLPTVASRARRCERIARRLDSQERRTLARGACTVPEGCTTRQRRRWARLAASFADDCVALNQVRVLGSHNSYHVEPRPALLAALLAFSPIFSEIEYTHLPLEQQFDEQGIRQIEIDVFADPMGGLYAHREGLGDTALESGAQYVSTDYPVPDPDFGTGYFVAIPGGVPGRCNPVNAPAGRLSSALERPC